MPKLKKYQLRFLEGPLSGKLLEIPALPTTLGRSSENVVWIADERCSRFHAQLRENHDGTLVIEDLGSKNGTLVNGQVVLTKALELGSEIQLGLSKFRIEAYDEKADHFLVKTTQPSHPEFDTLAKMADPDHLRGFQANATEFFLLDLLSYDSGKGISESLAQHLLELLDQQFDNLDFLQVQYIQSPSWTKAISKTEGKYAKPKKIPPLNARKFATHIPINSTSFVFPHPKLNATYPFQFFVLLSSAPKKGELDQLLQSLANTLLKLHHHLIHQELTDIEEQWRKLKDRLSG